MLAALAAVTAPITGLAQERGQPRQRIDVQSYLIDAQIDPRAQTLNATALVRFIPQEETSALSFELNNALNLTKVVDEDGRQVPASRMQQDMTVRLSLPQPLQKGKVAALTFVYDGKLTGNEESPVFGIKFAAIHPDFSYLMYPARWFPVNDYTADRFSSDLKVTVPAGYIVVASGNDSTETAPAGMTAFRFKFDEMSFPGSFAVVRGEAKPVSSGGVTTFFYLRESSDMAGAYGEEISRVMTYLTSLYGLPPKKNLTVVETEAGTPNGYSAPGLLFLSPKGIGKQVNMKLVANQVARQWWGTLVSPTTRNHIWLENGLARYAEFLYLEHVNGPSALEGEVHDTYVEALTVDQPPLMQASRLEDYSPEFWAATAGKGAAVLHMLRGVIGDENFLKVLKAFPEKFAWKSASTADFQKLSEEISGQGLNWFFLQWIESSGAPEFKMEYTVFRTQKGFRVMGKISQDLDTFRMPVELRIDTEGNPEEKKVEVVGTSSEFVVETFGKPRNVVLDPKGRVLRFDNPMRVAVAIRRGEQFAEVGEFNDALKEYQKALEVSRNSSLAHYRVGELFFLQNNYQSAANEFREALSGDLDPKWTEVWSHINLGKIFDITDQRERAVNEYRQALRTKDNTQGAIEEAGKYVNQKFERPRNTN
ncbi:MAG: peptidase M1 [Acidobacteria bacterium]|nr:MAG: peptidase M1 [Acidobacteriota bacterium]